MKKFITSLLCVSLLLSATSCAKSTPPAPAAPAAPVAEAPAAPVAEAPAAPADTAKKAPSEMRIYYLSKILGSQYWSIVEQGARDAANELGVNLTITGVAMDTEVEKQIQQLQDAVSAKADAIMVAPLDSTAMVNPIKDAYQSGIPFVLVDTMLKSEDYDVAYMTNNIEAGKLAAEELLKRMKANGVSETEKAQVAVQIGSAGSQTQIDRLDGFKEVWEATAPATWEYLSNDVKVNDGDVTKAVGFAQDFLTTYPDLKAFFGPNNGSTVGFAIGLKESGRKDITMLGFDFSDDVKSLIEQGDLAVSTIVQRQYYMGYEGLKEAVRLAQGEKPAERLIDTGVKVVDKQNVKDPEIVALINPEIKP